MLICKLGLVLYSVTTLITCCSSERQERRHITTAIFTYEDRCVAGDRRGASVGILREDRCVAGDRRGTSVRTLRKDSCGSSWPLRIDWVTGQVPGENF
jgi:hypothetical protein